MDLKLNDKGATYTYAFLSVTEWRYTVTNHWQALKEVIGLVTNHETNYFPGDMWTKLLPASLFFMQLFSDYNMVIKVYIVRGLLLFNQAVVMRIFAN